MIIFHVRRLWRAQPPPGWMSGQLPETIYHYLRARLFLTLMVFPGTNIVAGAIALWITGPDSRTGTIITATMAILVLPLLLFAGKCAGATWRLRKHLSENNGTRKVRWGVPRQYTASQRHLQQQGDTRASS